MIEPAPSGRRGFRYSAIEWEPGVVVCRFAGGAITRGDWGSLLRDQRDWYEAVVRACGYDSVPAYAVHHDFCHLWLPERLLDIPSPTLEAVARGWPAPPINRSEEFLVNTVQWVLAKGEEGREYRADYLAQIIGPEWPLVLDELQGSLDGLAAAD